MDLFTIIITLIVLGVLIIVHELGHFLVAKYQGITVHEFAIGMGPKILNFQKEETEYTIRLLPIGGYIKMDGEEGDLEDENNFSNKPVLSRLAVLFAGSFMNFLLAFVLIFMSLIYIGEPVDTIPIISDLKAGYSADIAGLVEGDKIININGNEISSIDDVSDNIRNSSNEIDLIVLRDGEEIEKTMPLIFDEEMGSYIIGISMTYEREISISFAFKTTIEVFRDIIKEIFNFFVRLFRREEGVSEDVGGIVAIGGIVGEAARVGFINIVLLTGFISINLAIMNLLPIPALDGGRILFLLIELVRGKPVDPEKEGIVHFIGFALLMILVIIITYRDIMNVFGG